MIKIDAQITISATYDDLIKVSVYDKNASATFIEMELTREQFINATMNRLAYTEVKNAYVTDLDKIGKRLEHKPFEFRISKYGDKGRARERVKKCCPPGYTPDLEFSSQNSFFDKDGVPYARTTIRRWV